MARRVRARFEWKFEDFWVGAFWRREGAVLHVWVCILPCIPLHVEVEGKS